MLTTSSFSWMVWASIWRRRAKVEELVGELGAERDRVLRFLEQPLGVFLSGM